MIKTISDDSGTGGDKGTAAEDEVASPGKDDPPPVSLVQTYPAE